MFSLCPYEIVAPVVSWSYHHIVRGQCFEGVFENRSRRVRTVSLVEGDDAGR